MKKALPRTLWIFLIIALLVFTGCDLSPQRSVSPTEEVAGFILPTLEPTLTPTLKPTITPIPMDEACNNYVAYVQDVNLPDDSEVEPGSLVTKKWEVKNTGTCNWGPGYVWKLQESSGVDVPDQFNIYPALKGTSATISLTFIAPETPGTYIIDYIPYGPDGMAIGENVYTRFIVSDGTE